MLSDHNLLLNQIVGSNFRENNSAVSLEHFNCEILIWCILRVMAFARSLNFMDHAEWPQFIIEPNCRVYLWFALHENIC